MATQADGKQATRTRDRRPLSVVDQVTNHLIEMIVSGELRPEQALTIVDLAAELGVSHIPVREALRRLEGDGLILYHRGKGAQVAPVSRQEITDILAIRAALEPDLARRSFDLLDDGALGLAAAKLDEYVATLSQAHSPPGAVGGPHVSFHLALLPGASAWDLKILEQLYRGTERYVQLYRGHARAEHAALEDMLDAHRLLLSAARSDRRAFVKAIGEHVGWSEKLVLSLFDSQTPSF